jgi:hypothetical protein
MMVTVRVADFGLPSTVPLAKTFCSAPQAEKFLRPKRHFNGILSGFRPAGLGNETATVEAAIAIEANRSSQLRDARIQHTRRRSQTFFFFCPHGGVCVGAAYPRNGTPPMTGGAGQTSHQPQEGQERAHPLPP